LRFLGILLTITGSVQIMVGIYAIDIYKSNGVENNSLQMIISNVF